MSAATPTIVVNVRLDRTAITSPQQNPFWRGHWTFFGLHGATGGETFWLTWFPALLVSSNQFIVGLISVQCRGCPFLARWLRELTEDAALQATYEQAWRSIEPSNPLSPETLKGI